MPPVGVAEFIFRAGVGVFVSAALGFLCWVVARFILISFFDLTPLNDRVVSMIAIGIGAGVGAGAGSLMLDISRLIVALRLLLGGAIGVLGAWLGYLIGKDAYIMVGMPGIAELGGIVQGALIAANLFPITLDLINAARDWNRRRNR